MKSKLLNMIILLCILVTMCSGCGTDEITIYNADDRIKEHLEEKYGMEFEVSDAKPAFVPSGLPGALANTYCAEAYCKSTGQSCYALIDKDGGNFKDDYCKTFLQEPLESYALDVVSGIENINVTDCHAVFTADSGCWSEQSNIEDYMNSSDTYVCMTIEADGVGLDEAVDLGYRVYKELEDSNMHPNIEFVYGENDVYLLSQYKDTEKESEDETRDYIRRWLSN